MHTHTQTRIHIHTHTHRHGYTHTQTHTRQARLQLFTFSFDIKCRLTDLCGLLWLVFSCYALPCRPSTTVQTAYFPFWCFSCVISAEAKGVLGFKDSK